MDQNRLVWIELWVKGKSKCWSEWKWQLHASVTLTERRLMSRFPPAASVSIRHLLLNWSAGDTVSLSSDTGGVSPQQSWLDRNVAQVRCSPVNMSSFSSRCKAEWFTGFQIFFFLSSCVALQSSPVYTWAMVIFPPQFTAINTLVVCIRFVPSVSY